MSLELSIPSFWYVSQKKFFSFIGYILNFKYTVYELYFPLECVATYSYK